MVMARPTWPFTTRSRLPGRSTNRRDGSTFKQGIPKSSTYAGSLPVVGNFSGPGASEYGVFDFVNGQGQWTVTTPNQGTRTVLFAAAQAGDIPQVGDFDGVGYDQFAVYRPSTGQFLVLQNPTQFETITIPGLTADPNLVPVAAQYECICATPYKTEAAVYDPAKGVFTIAGPAGVITVTFQAGDIPVSADYLGSGRFQPAVFAEHHAVHREGVGGRPDRTRSSPPSRLSILRRPSSRSAPRCPT